LDKFFIGIDYTLKVLPHHFLHFNVMNIKNIILKIISIDSQIPKKPSVARI